MTEVKTIKRFMLQALLAAHPEPMPQSALDIAVKETLARPLQSDINEARRELEAGAYIIGTKDDLDESVSWALTAKGAIKAKQL